MADRRTCSPSTATRFREWIATRGGVAVWTSLNLANPGASWSTPALHEDGTPANRPTWQADVKPARIITDPADIDVVEPKEVKRFRVAVRFGGNGLTLKVTDAGSRRIYKELGKAGDDAWYDFDYETQEAIIFVPGKVTPLSEWQPADIEGIIREGRKLAPNGGDRD